MNSIMQTEKATFIKPTHRYRCLVKLTCADNEGSGSALLKGVVTHFTSTTINVVIPGGDGITFKYNQKLRAWESSLDDQTTYADLQPDPLESEEDFKAVETIISIND